MPETPAQTSRRLRRQASKGPTSVKGSRAGESFDAPDPTEQDWQDYKVAKKLSFAAQRKEHEEDFQSWRKKRSEETEARKKQRDE